MEGAGGIAPPKSEYVHGLIARKWICRGALGKTIYYLKLTSIWPPTLGYYFMQNLWRLRPRLGMTAYRCFSPLPTEIPQLLASCLLLNGDEYGKMWDSSQTDYAKRSHGYWGIIRSWILCSCFTPCIVTTLNGLPKHWHPELLVRGLKSARGIIAT